MMHDLPHSLRTRVTIGVTKTAASKAETQTRHVWINTEYDTTCAVE